MADNPTNQKQNNDYSDSVMVCFYVPQVIATSLALDSEGALPAEELHITLAYLGKLEEIKDPDNLKHCLAQWAKWNLPIEGRVNGIARFHNPESEEQTDAFVLVFDSPYLPGFRQSLVSELEWNADIKTRMDHGFIPHITLAYVPFDGDLPLQTIEPVNIKFDTLSLSFEDERIDIPLTGSPEEVAKAGARHSRKDTAMVQEIHDHAVKLGAMCPESEKATKLKMGWSCGVKPFCYHDTQEEADAHIKATMTEGQDETGGYAVNGESDGDKAPITKKEGDGEHPASHYLVVEDPEQVTTWHLRVRNAAGELDHGLMGGAWAALHSGYRGNKYEGANKEEALSKLKKLYEQEGMETPDEKSDSDKTLPGNALKALRSDENTLVVGNYLALWGGRNGLPNTPGGTDLEGLVSNNKNQDGSLGEYFSPKTDFESEYTKSVGRLAVDWEHRQAPEANGPTEEDILGYVDWSTAKADSSGLWVERVLNRRNQYIKMLESLIKDGLIGTSSEAIPTEVKKAKDGRILKWPLFRDTLTVSPMEPRMLSDNHILALKALGVEFYEPSIKQRIRLLKINALKKRYDAII